MILFNSSAVAPSLYSGSSGGRDLLGHEHLPLLSGEQGVSSKPMSGNTTGSPDAGVSDFTSQILAQELKAPIIGNPTGIMPSFSQASLDKSSSVIPFAT